MVIAGIIAVMLVLSLIDYTTQPRFIRRAMLQYKSFAFKKLTEKGISSFRDESTAAYLSALTNDAAGIETDYLSNLLAIITKASLFFGSLILMLCFSPLLTGVAVIVTILPLIASLLTGSRLVTAEKKVSDRNKDFTASLSDCLSGFSVVKTFKAEKEIYDLFSKNNKALENDKCSKRRILSMVGMIGGLTGLLAQLGVFLAGTAMALNGSVITAGTILMFVNLMNFMIQPVAELPKLLAGRKAALGLIDKLAANLEQNTAPSGSTKLPALEKDIKLENVSFGYEEDKEILHNVSATFKAGKAYAIVGASGSGKSTLLNLLMNSTADYKGHILMDGEDIHDISSDSLYDLMSVIQQNVFVFNASIKDNVTMFKDFSNEELETAMKQARLDTLIRERGTDALCGENGCELSGGEKQRVSIARSLLKKSSVLLADEATAALDRETAYQVSSDILDLKGITRITVTHSLEESLLKRYDGILVLKDGRVEEFGTFNDLMKADGYFHALYTIAQ
jgi:ABC-type multidrug transport system fused ATPase/permease subunit